MMTIKQIYNLAISEGIRHDLRGAARVREILKRINKKYEKLWSLLTFSERFIYDRRNSIVC